MKQQGAKADMVYGDTGSTKTSRLGDAAEYLKRTTGKPSRLVSADSGGWEPIQSLVDYGTIQAFALTSQRPNIIEDMSKLSQGWWPADVNDPLSQLAPPKSFDKVAGDFDGIAGLFFEGATSFCNLMMQAHTSEVTYNAASQTISPRFIRVPEMPKDSYVKSGDYIRRFTGRSDYGGVQDRIGEFIRNSAMLPVKVIWTALETKGTDELKQPIYGPDFIGQALTGKCGPWFGNLIHLDFVIEAPSPAALMAANVKPAATPTVLRPKPVMFLRSHIDPSDPYKLVYPAKVRAPRTLWAEVPDFMEPRLDKLYELLDKLAEKEKTTHA